MSVLISITENFVPEVLYLRNNRLTKIPVLTHCLNLKELHLGSNKISGIQHVNLVLLRLFSYLNTLSLHAGLEAEQLENIVNVKMLDLRENKITKLPDEIHCLQSLERLDVSNNDLSALPFTLGKFICHLL